MNDEDRRRVFNAILKNGDDFWNKPDEGWISEQIEEGRLPADPLKWNDSDWNGFLFDEILTMAKTEGLSIVVLTEEERRVVWNALWEAKLGKPAGQLVRLLKVLEKFKKGEKGSDFNE